MYLCHFRTSWNNLNGKLFYIFKHMKIMSGDKNCFTKTKHKLPIWVCCIKHVALDRKCSKRLRNSICKDVLLKRNINSSIMIFATVTRFVASRKAVKTIYWRTVEDGDGVRLVKHTKTLNIEGPGTQRRNILYWWKVIKWIKKRKLV